MPERAWFLLVRNQLLGFVREPAAAVFNLAVPFFIVLIQAFAYGDQPARAADGALLQLRVVDVLPISAATMYVMIIGLFGMAVGLSSMAESRTLSAFKLRPGGLASVITAYGTVLLVLTLAGLISSVLLLVSGWDVPFTAHIALLVPLVLLCIVAFLALGSCVAALSSSPRSAQGIASALFFPMLFLSGATYPISGYPRALQLIAEALPGLHAFELLSYSWMPGGVFPWASLIYLLVVASALPVIAGRVFSRREAL